MNRPENRNHICLIALHPTDKFPFIGESQGICAISGYLQTTYPEVSVWLYDQQTTSLEKMIEGILEHRPALVGISVKISTYPEFRKLYAQMSQSVFPVYKPLIVAGNSVPHFSGEEILRNHYPDIIVSLGEGEVSFGDLYEYVQHRREFTAVRNIMYRKGEEVVRSGFAYLDKERIPFADRCYSLIYYNRGGEVYIEGSRGCAYCACSICECRLFLGSTCSTHKWRDRPVGSVLDELELLASQGIEVVTFSDEDFLGTHSAGLARAIEFSEEMLRRGIHIRFRINARVRALCNRNDTPEMAAYRREVLVRLRQAGLTKVFLGFESGSQSQIDRYRKGFRLEEFLTAKSMLTGLNIDFELGFICLDPLMSMEELKESLEFIRTNECIPYISSVYKELRIQKGNDHYLRAVRACEQAHGIQLIGELDFDEQKYNILRYKDDRITRVNEQMREYDRETYKLYYLMRILTQYSREADNDEVGRFIYRTIDRIKHNDYDLLTELIGKVEKGEPDSSLQESLNCYLHHRETIYLRILDRIKEQNVAKYMYLKDTIYTTYSR
ncbi:MAG: radical SAM protein [Bacteroides sp.]|nr:radical SAM protein [Bacteroides sp.]